LIPLFFLGVSGCIKNADVKLAPNLIQSEQVDYNFDEAEIAKLTSYLKSDLNSNFKILDFEPMIPSVALLNIEASINSDYCRITRNTAHVSEYKFSVQIPSESEELGLEELQTAYDEIISHLSSHYHGLPDIDNVQLGLIDISNDNNNEKWDIYAVFMGAPYSLDAVPDKTLNGVRWDFHPGIEWKAIELTGECSMLGMIHGAPERLELFLNHNLMTVVGLGQWYYAPNPVVSGTDAFLYNDPSNTYQSAYHPLPKMMFSHSIAFVPSALNRCIPGDEMNHYLDKIENVIVPAERVPNMHLVDFDIWSNLHMYTYGFLDHSIYITQAPVVVNTGYNSTNL